MDNRKVIKKLLDQNKSNFTIKTLDELMCLIDNRGEREFTIETCMIFGDNNNNDFTRETLNTFGIELAKKKLNFREVIASFAFFTMDNYYEKIKSRKIIFYQL